MSWSLELNWYKMRVLDIPRFCPAQGADMPDWRRLIRQMVGDDPRAEALYAAASEWLGVPLTPMP